MNKLCFFLAIILMAAPVSSGVPAFGTLQTEPKHLKEEYAGGVRVAMIEVFWNRYEKSDNSFDASYIAGVKSQIRDFKAAGFVVTLAPGTHFAPKWLKELPGSRFVDQDGRQSPDVNFIFNQKMRNYLERYLKHLDDELGFENFWAIRLTSGGNGELLRHGAAPSDLLCNAALTDRKKFPFVRERFPPARAMTITDG